MSGTVVGRVASLHRYPVKSMRGEAPGSVEIGPAGIVGDRAYALVDRETGYVVSAKRPDRWPGLMDHEAAFRGEPATDAIPSADIRTPGGATFATDDPGPLETALSEEWGRRVGLLETAPPDGRYEYHWPDVDGLVFKGRTYRDEVTEHRIRPGSFFDSTPVHLLTTSSLAALRARAPEHVVDPRRFRANVVLETGGESFVEDGWVGRTLSLGTVKLRLYEACVRCVMVTLPQDGLPGDVRLLKSIFAHNGGSVGVKASVEVPGRLSVGDPVTLD